MSCQVQTSELLPRREKKSPLNELARLQSKKSAYHQDVLLDLTMFFLYYRLATVLCWPCVRTTGMEYPTPAFWQLALLVGLRVVRQSLLP